MQETENTLGELAWCKQFIGALLEGIPKNEISSQLCLEETSCKKYLNADKEEVEQRLIEILESIEPYKEKASLPEPKTKHPYENIDPEVEEKIEQKEQEKAKNSHEEENDQTHIPQEKNVKMNEQDSSEEEVEQPQPLVKPSFRDKMKQRKNNKNGTKVISLKKRTVQKTKKEKSVGKKEWKESEKMSFKNTPSS